MKRTSVEKNILKVIPVQAMPGCLCNSSLPASICGLFLRIGEIGTTAG
jgi:hypothetical protein